MRSWQPWTASKAARGSSSWLQQIDQRTSTRLCSGRDASIARCTCAILESHAEGKPIAEVAKALEIIAQTTPGMSGADLANLINEAAILCAQNNTSTITLVDLEAARDKVRFGKERR